MKRMSHHKYRPYPTVDLTERRWPDKTITSAPIWCSVDLRDGNQALINPMSLNEKLDMYRLLLEIGFKEIEVGFPSASQTEFDFLRRIIEEGLIPAGITIQVLTQAREHLIEKTFKAIAGAPRAIVHLYNSTSEVQRRVVFGKDKQGTIDLAVEGTSMVREKARQIQGTEVLYEYSPESFTGTELDFALDISEAVLEAWQPDGTDKVIINLPATVEMSTPNVYADRIEWFSTRLRRREAVILSVHPHNDRGTAVAAAELALMAGAQRIEGTLFGNGERTGNVDIITLAMNMASQGVDPCLDLHDINGVIETSERCTRIPVHVRHPYAGELVYTAFSGSHQDAIRKGIKHYFENGSGYWEVPYLPVDPSDTGRNYEAIIRINSQSGKGGIAYVLEKEFNMTLPKRMHPEFAAVIQTISDSTGKEIESQALWNAFEATYLARTRFRLTGCTVAGGQEHSGTTVEADIEIDGIKHHIRGTGNGPIDALTGALADLGYDFRVADYSEHALSAGSDSRAAAYVLMENAEGLGWWGVGIDENIQVASFKAIMSAAARATEEVNRV